MKLLGFSLTKIACEKFTSNFKEIKVDNKIEIEDIQGSKQDFLKEDEEVIIVKFSYSVDYKEKVALISLEGHIILALDKNVAAELLKSWKDKETSEEFRVFCLNIVLKKATLKVLELEEELGLPLHIQFPTLKKKS